MMLLDLLRARPGRAVALAIAGLFAVVFLAGLVVLAAEAGTARMALLAVTGGLLIGGAALSYVAIRTVDELGRLQAGKRSSAEELARSEERFRLLAENARDLVYRYRLSPEPGFEYVSPSSTTITGFTPEEHYADPQLGFKMIHPEDRHLLEGTLRSPNSHLTLRWYRKDGQVIWTEQRNKMIYDASGNPIALEGIARDVTGRKRTEEELAKSEERFRLLAENMSDLVCLHEPDGRYLYVSPSCRSLLGYEPEELIGVDPYTLFHPEDAERIRSEPHRLALEGQTPPSITYRFRKKDGAYTWLETLTEPILDGAGEVIRLQTSSRDVNDRRRAEEALARLVRARTEFLADVSHELRTPLTVIRGNAEVGLDLGRDCDHAELLQEIVHEAAAMSRMVEDLLFLARSDSATPPFQLEPVSTNSFLEGLAGRATLLAQERGATLEARLEGSGRLRIDPTRVEQAVLALVDNAAKYTPEDERISLTARIESGELRITVEDRGPGIPEKDLPRVFERFYRVDDEREQDGNGLGLSIAAAIAEAHGGRIRAESPAGEGTRMSLYLPLLEPAPAEKPPQTGN